MSNVDQIIIAKCGLVCSSCGAFTRGKCKGCDSQKPMFKNCPVKKCSTEKNYQTCAQCTEYPDLKKCKKLHNFISIIFGFLFRSNRLANLKKIRTQGLDIFKSSHH